ncbi:MAG TPA: alpha/beta hydrolase-fold protein [Paucimonas sp.]|nr:alpha/beta hydrolase-fold protein [Paucimonas sp.]
MTELMRRATLLRLAAMAAVTPFAAAVPPAWAGAGRAKADSEGRFVVFDAFPSKHVAARKVVVWLPPGYDTSDGRHAVLYMHDGQNLFDPATSMANQPWAVDKHLIALQRAGKVRPTIVVGIWNTPDRAREYGPAAAVEALAPELRDVLLGTGRADTLSDQYLRFIVEELKPFIDKTYRTRPGRDDTVVMGSSMGGLISLYALASYPDVFGGAGCLSTHWPLTSNHALLGKPPGDPRVAKIAASYIDWLRTHLPAAGKHRLYFDYGTKNVDAFYAPYQEQVDKIVAAKSYRRDADWTTRFFPGTDHNEAAWRERLDIPLRFLLRPL